jgi:hypothetical protein
LYYKAEAIILLNESDRICEHCNGGVDNNKCHWAYNYKDDNNGNDNDNDNEGNSYNGGDKTNNYHNDDYMKMRDVNRCDSNYGDIVYFDREKVKLYIYIYIYVYVYIYIYVYFDREIGDNRKKVNLDTYVYV